MTTAWHSDDFAARLLAARGFVFDLDGTLVLGDKRNQGIEALPGGDALLRRLDDRGTDYRILTNGTVKTPEQISAALANAGLDVPPDRVMTPSTVAARYFSNSGMNKIMVLGVDGVSQPLVDVGLTVVRPGIDESTADADAIFIGWYRQIHMDEVEAACEAVWNGARLFAASMVPFFATRSGRALGSSRAISAMITSITGAEATPLGKPSPHALRDAAEQMGCGTGDLVVFGDDPALEVRMALEGGAVAVGVHTGVAGAEAFSDLPDAERPHGSFPDIGEFDRYFASLL